jgi:hypothetical protein
MRDLLDGADLSYLDAGTAVVSLLHKKILVPMTHRQIAEIIRPQKVKKGAAVGFFVIILMLALLSTAGYYRFLALPGQIDAGRSYVARMFKEATLSDLESIRYSMQIFHLQNGRLPKSIDSLETSGIADGKQLTDRWGRPFHYERKGNSFVLYSLGPEEFISGDEIYLPKK